MKHPAPVRMKKRKMFVNVTNHGQRVVAGGIVVQACPNQLGIVRTGFTVTKKLGSAVIRNRTRRRLREVVRLCPDLGMMVGYDVVFVGRQSTKDRPFSKLQADLKYALHEIKRQMEKPSREVYPNQIMPTLL